MIGFRCVQQGNRINPYTVSIKNNGKIEPLKSTIGGLFENKQSIISQQIIIGNNVGICYQAFANCMNLNSNVVISYGVTNCVAMFSNCYNLNQNIKMPDSVENCQYMFRNCGLIFTGREIKISNNAKDIAFMFADIWQLPGNVHIPASVENCREMFAGDVAHEVRVYPNVYFEAKTYKYIDVTRMFGHSYPNITGHYNRNARKNIFFNTALNNVFNEVQSKIADTSVQWTPMTNGFYNSLYNFYMYNNY